MNARATIKHPRLQRAITLVEMMAAVAIASIIMLALAMMLVGPHRLWLRGGVRSDLQREMSLANEKVARALRQANWITITGQGSSLTFLQGDSNGRIFREGAKLVIEIDEQRDDNVRYLADLQFTPAAGRVRMNTLFFSQGEEVRGELTVDLRNLSIVGDWPMNEGGGNVTYEASGRSNHGALYDTTWSALEDGRYALSFDSSNPSYVRVPSSDRLYTGRRTVYEFRVQRRSFDALFPTLYSRGARSRHAGFHWIFIYPVYGNIGFQGCDGSDLVTIYSDRLQWEAGKWYNITVIIDAEYQLISFWRDGEHVGTRGAPANMEPVIDGDAYIGWLGENLYEFIRTGWDGKIDTVVIGTN